jgi:hypothetical protein
MISPTILPLFLNSVIHADDVSAGGGGTTIATGSPFSVIRIGSPFIFTCLSRPRHVDLNLDIVTVSVFIITSNALHYRRPDKVLWSRTIVNTIADTKKLRMAF